MKAIKLTDNIICVEVVYGEGVDEETQDVIIETVEGVPNVTMDVRIFNVWDYPLNDWVKVFKITPIANGERRLLGGQRFEVKQCKS